MSQVVEPETPEPVHVVALSGLKTKKAQVRYCCDHLVEPSTAEVLAWCHRYGVVADPQRERSRVSTIVNQWRRERGLSDTGDVPSMSPDMLAAMDELTEQANARTEQPNARPEHPNSEGEHPAEQSNSEADRLPEQANSRGGFPVVFTEQPDALVEQLNTVAEQANAPVERETEQANTRPEQPNSEGEHPAEHPNSETEHPAGQAGVSQLLSVLSRSSWVAVLVMALGISWWSLFDLARVFGVPVVLAAGVSVVFDAAALVCAKLSHQYSLSPDSGAGPRLTMLALVAGSVYLNWNHAQLSGFGTEAAVMYAAPAVVAVLLFELESGWRSREGRRARGRVAEPLPALGRWGWLLHPWQSVVTVWRVSRERGQAVRDRELARAKQAG